MITKLKYLFLILILICSAVHADTIGSAGQEIAFLDTSIGTRPTAMGGAFTAAADDANAVLWNPAGLVFMPANSFTSLQTRLATDVNYYYMALGFPAIEEELIYKGKENPNLRNKWAPNTGQDEGFDEGRAADKAELTEAQRKEASKLISSALQAETLETPDLIYQAKSAWGVSWVNAGVSEIPLISTTDSTITTDIEIDGYTDYQAHALNLGWAWSINRGLAWGIGLTGIYQNIASVSTGKAYGGTATLGMLWKESENFRVGFVLKDFASYIKWDTGTVETVIPEARLGVAWYWSLADVAISLDLRNRIASGHPLRYYAGAEWGIIDLIVLRAGYGESSVTAGAGIKVATFGVDFTYTGTSAETNLGTATQVAFSMDF